MTQDIFQKLDDEIHFRKGGIYSKMLARSAGFSCTLMCLAKGAELEEHTTPKAVLLHVVRGSGDFDLEGKKLGMEPGVLIRMKPDAPHALKAEEDLAFLLYLFDE